MGRGLDIRLICGIDTLSEDRPFCPEDWYERYSEEGEDLTVRVPLPDISKETWDSSEEYLQQIDAQLFFSLLEDEEEQGKGKYLKDVLYWGGPEFGESSVFGYSIEESYDSSLCYALLSCFPIFAQTGHIDLPKEGEGYRYFPRFAQWVKVAKYLFECIGLESDTLKLMLVYSWS